MSDDIVKKNVRVSPLDSRVDYYVDEVIHLVVDDATIDNGTLWDVMKPVYHELSGIVSLEEYFVAAEKLTVPQRQVYVCDRYFGEVLNGGHHQFYFNTTGMYWEEALKGLRSLEMQESANALEDSINLFDRPPEFDARARHEQLWDLPSDCFEDIDDRFFAISTSSADFLSYVRGNRQAFYYSGSILEKVGYRTETVFLMPSQSNDNNTNS